MGIPADEAIWYAQARSNLSALEAFALTSQSPRTTVRPLTVHPVPLSLALAPLAAASYSADGEVRNIGQLMSTGGVGEVVDQIVKLAEPPQEFKSIIKFLKTNSEALATARLLFATWPARTDIPDAFVAIEFAT